MSVKAWLKTGILAIGAGALLSGSAMAASSDADAQKQKKKDELNRMVCRSIMKSGTRISERICRTRMDWDRDAREAEDAALAQTTGPGFQPLNKGVVTGAAPH
jgi:hypothetical protein